MICNGLAIIIVFLLPNAERGERGGIIVMVVCIFDASACHQGIAEVICNER